MINESIWHLRDQKGISYFESELLSKNGFKNFFFTKLSQKQSPESLIKQLINERPDIHLLNQVHSNKVIKASQSYDLNLIDADSMISDSKNQSLWIYSADCIPILFADLNQGNVAATHAGWKGLSKNVIKNTTQSLIKNGCKSDDLIVAIGPCISSKHYEVDSTVITSIENSLQSKKDTLPKIKESKIESMLRLKIIKKGKDINKFLLDIRLLAYYQLIKEGVKSKNISISNICTFKEKNLFNSWRRDKVRSRQWSSIVSN